MEKNTTGKDAAYPVLKAWLLYTLAVIMVMYFCVGSYGSVWLGALGIGLVGIIITSIFLLRNHQNPEECSDAGQVYGKIGLGLALYVCLAGVLTLLYKCIMPELFGESIMSAPWYSRIRIIFSRYMVAFPAFYYICKRIKRTPPEQHKMTFGQFMSCIFMNQGILLVGFIIGAVISAMFLFKMSNVGIGSLQEDMTNAELLWRILTIGVVTPIFEELIFRKLFIDRVHIYGEGMAILASGLLYALYQGDFIHFFYSVGIGAFFAYIYIRTGKIWYTIIFRMICELSLTIAVLVLFNRIDFEALSKILSMNVAEEQMIVLVKQMAPGLMLLLLWLVVFIISGFIGTILWISKRKNFYLKEADFCVEGRKAKCIFGNFGILYFLLFVLMAFLSSYGIGRSKEYLRLQHQKAWIKEIDGPLREGLSSAVGVNEFLPEKERNARLDELIRQIEEGMWNDDEIAYKIQEIISDIHIAHIGFFPASDYRTENYYTSFVIDGKWFSDGFYILKTMEEDRDCLGGKLLAINGISLEKVLSRYDGIYSNETQMCLKSLFERSLEGGLHKSELEYLGISEPGSNDITLTVEKDGLRFEHRMEAVRTDGLQDIQTVELETEQSKLPYGERIYRREGKAPFYYEIDKENRALYLQYNQCYDATVKEEYSIYPAFEAFFDQLIEDMKAHEAEIDYFVLDLRNNTGGYLHLWDNAVAKHKKYLKQYPIRILVGKGTYSAAVDAIDRTLFTFDDVVLYGEEAGLAIYNYTGIIESVLENTGGTLTVTTRKAFYRELNTRAYVRSEDIYAGVMPDVEVLQTFEGYRNGVDEVYLKAVSQ